LKRGLGCRPRRWLRCRKLSWGLGRFESGKCRWTVCRGRCGRCQRWSGGRMSSPRSRGAFVRRQCWATGWSRLLLLSWIATTTSYRSTVDSCRGGD
jgi:hypothetical protein